MAELTTRHPIYHDLLQRLAVTGRLRTASIACEGVCLALAVGIGLGLVSCALDNRLHLSEWGLVALDAAWLGAVGWILWTRLTGPLARRGGLRQVALKVEEKHPDLDNNLLNVLDLGRQDLPYSGALVEAALRESAARFDSLNWRAAADWKGSWRWGRMAATAVILLAFYAGLWPRHLTNAALRLTRPFAGISPLTATRLLVEPGTVSCLPGECIRIQARVAGAIPEAAELQSCFRGGRWISRSMPRQGRASFGYTLVNLRRSVQYAVSAGDARSPVYSIQVRETPEAASFEVRYRYPKFAHLANRVVRSARGDLRGPIGTQVEVTIASSRPLAAAAVVLDGRSQPLKVADEDDRRASFSLRLDRAGVYSLLLRDRLGRENMDRPRYRITVDYNRPPSVSLVEPGRDLSAASTAAVPMIIQAEDDFGLEQLSLRFRVDGGPVRAAQSWKASGSRLFSPSLQWSLAGLRPRSGSVITYQAEARDSMGAVGVSESYRIRIFSGPLVNPGGFARQLQQVREIIAKFKAPSKPGDQDRRRAAATRRELEKLRERLKGIKEEQERLLTDTRLTPPPPPKPTPEEAKKWQALVDRQTRIAEQIRDFNSFIARMPEQDFDKATFLKALADVYQKLEEAAAKLRMKAQTIACSQEEVGLLGIGDLDRLIAEGIAKLPTTPDNLKWMLEEPDLIGKMPMGLLPEELQDLMGDVIDQQEDINEATEDVTSAWAVPDDFYEGEIRGGPISNMSAKGKTGNELPDSNLQMGRSGEGRTGKSAGELVEGSTIGKDNRRMPARLADPRDQGGVVQQRRAQLPGLATGGGKRTGAGPRGAHVGSAPPEIVQTLQRLSDLQAQVRQRAERVQLELQNLEFASVSLDRQIAAMRELEGLLKSHQILSIGRRQQEVLAGLRSVYGVFSREAELHQERSQPIPKQLFKNVRSPSKEVYLPEYADLLDAYYRALARAAR